MLPTQQQPQQQQRAAVPSAPTYLMQQPPLPPQPRPLQPLGIPGQVQQPMNYQAQQIQQPLPQVPFQVGTLLVEFMWKLCVFNAQY